PFGGSRSFNQARRYQRGGRVHLGQLVEDVSGQALREYLRDRVLDPLGMQHTDLTRSDRVSPGLATGYVLRRRGLVPARVREVPTPGGGGLYSTAADLACYLRCLLEGGSGPRGRILDPETVAQLFTPHYQPDPRLPGMGLGFDLAAEDGRRVAAKDGVVSGFLSAMALAPSAGTGVLALANTGGLSGRGAPVEVVGAVLRELLDLPEDPIRHDITPRPDVWAELCGWYAPTPGMVTNLFTRTLMGAGAEVVVEDRRLVLKPLTPVPALRRGMVLHPDDPKDPYAFRVDFSSLGMGTLPVVFATTDDGGRVGRLWLDLMGFDKRRDTRNPRRLLGAGLAAATVAGGVARLTRRSSADQTH
ncbi:serine hydrolase domain-containing protein, partial [Terrabacter lapilli]|uniref:serine hydrolase domain-containing protein n=1 Tax=Terrabacter lapilli TaxID=436231 RepID=UPI0031E45629